jgi:aspartate/methionine/tyrosine aminotransferase
MSLADRLHHIAPFRVMDILGRAKALQASGADVIHMEVGEPDFSAPTQVLKAAEASLQKAQTHYTPAAGLPQLREAIAQYYSDHFGVSISAKRIVITPGASGALQLILGILVNPSDKVWIQDPGYPCNRHMITMFGGEAQALPSGNALLDVDASAQAITKAALKAMLVATPANPTGQVLSTFELGNLITACRSANTLPIVDEIYQGLQYDSSPTTALSFDHDDLFVINSFSKFFGMTGFRVGWLVAPEAYVEPIERLAQNLFLAPPTTAQFAALAALTDEVRPELFRRRDALNERRDRLYAGLKNAGFALSESKPGGAFYIYAKLPEGLNDGISFAEHALNEAHVAITPGADFGFNDTSDYIRFAYTTDIDRIEEAVGRLQVLLS